MQLFEKINPNNLIIVERAPIMEKNGDIYINPSSAIFLEALKNRWNKRLILFARHEKFNIRCSWKITNLLNGVIFIPWHNEKGSYYEIAKSFYNTFKLLFKQLKKAKALYIILPSYWGIIAVILARILNKRAVLQISGDTYLSIMATSSVKYPKLLKHIWATIWDISLRINSKKALAVIASEAVWKTRYKIRKFILYRPFYIIPHNEIYLREDCCKAFPIKLLYVGTLASHKGIRDLIQAVNLLPKGYYILNLVGEDKSDGLLKKEVERLKLEKYINFIGYISQRDKLLNFYRNSDIFILPSFTEGTPRVLYEAMSQSLPIITTTVGGIPLFLEDKKSAYFVGVGKPEEIAAAILQIVEDRALRKNLIKGGYEKINNLITQDWIKEVLNIIEGYNNY